MTGPSLGGARLLLGSGMLFSVPGRSFTSFSMLGAPVRAPRLFRRPARIEYIWTFPPAVLMGLVVTGATIGAPTNLKNPSDHVPVMVTVAPKPRMADGPPPIPGR
eukprot:9498930-Pyramimonas_sp.AAC.1